MSEKDAGGPRVSSAPGDPARGASRPAERVGEGRPSLGVLPGGGEREKERALPRCVGLCPVHYDEFYVPHGGRCPEPGCDEYLRLYFRDDDAPAS